MLKDDMMKQGRGLKWLKKGRRNSCTALKHMCTKAHTDNYSIEYEYLHKDEGGWCSGRYSCKTLHGWSGTPGSRDLTGQTQTLAQTQTPCQDQRLASWCHCPGIWAVTSCLLSQTSDLVCVACLVPTLSLGEGCSHHCR